MLFTWAVESLLRLRRAKERIAQKEMLLALLFQLHADAAAEQHAEKAAGASELWIVEQVNHVFGPTVLAVERAILPPIYHLFGLTWHEPAPGEMVIPIHVLMALIVLIL